MFRLSAPLGLAVMAGLLSERSGVIQIGLEGLMLFGAFSAAAAATFFLDPWLALAFGCSTSVAVACFYAWLTVSLKADQIIAGTAINLLAWGSIPFVCKIIFGVTANTPSLEQSSRLPEWSPAVLALMAFLFVYVLITRTRFGMWLTFAGESPQALVSVGVSIRNVRWFAIALSGVFAGMGGSILSIALSSSYTRNMVSGRGFMALAALILGKWRPGLGILSALLFGVSEYFQLRLQDMTTIASMLPLQVVQMIPYLLTLLILAGVAGESRAPRALGR